MITENQFKKWFYSLPTEENRRAKREILEKFDMSASLFYYWLGENYSFNKLKRDALNAFAKEFNNTIIFIEEPKKEVKL